MRAGPFWRSLNEYVHLRISREAPSKCPPARVMEQTTLTKSIFEESLTECAVYVTPLKSVKQKKVVEDDGVSENEYDENLGDESGAKIILESTFVYMAQVSIDKIYACIRVTYSSQKWFFLVCNPNSKYAFISVT